MALAVRLEVVAQKEKLKKKRKKKRRTDHELYKKRNSLIISPLFFDAFTGELISLITRVNYERSPPPPPPLTEDYLIYFFFFNCI